MLQHGIESLRLGLETSGKSDELELHSLNILSILQAELDLPPSFNTAQGSKIKFEMSATNLNGRRPSGSPTDKKLQGGGVALPLTPKGLHASERAASVGIPYTVFGDPFAQNSGVKLSAGAHVFKPNGTKQAPAPIRILNRDSTADEQPTIVTSPTPAVDNAEKVSGKATAQQPIGTRTNNMSPSQPKVFFTTDVGPNVPFQGGHYVKIENISRFALDAVFTSLLQDFGWDNKILCAKAKPVNDGKTFVYVFCFDDSRSTANAFEEVEMVGSDWSISYISQTEYASAIKEVGTGERTTFHDGQVVFSVSFDGPTSEFNPTGASDAVHELAKEFGELRAFTAQPSHYPTLEYRAEYYKITDAQKALNSATKQKPRLIGKWTVTAEEMPNSIGQAASANGGNNVAALQNGVAGMNITNTPHRQSNGGAATFTSPTGRTAWRADENGNVYAAEPARILPKIGHVPFGAPMTAATPHRDRFFSAPSPHTPSHFMDGTYMQQRSDSWNGPCYSHNNSPRRSPIPSPQAVEVWKIANGQDVRTTVMLRNIPNRMDCWQLKEILDVTSYGHYDFSYLRIDFEKGTNVGYAFVNFADPMNIIPFVEHWSGQRWQANNPRLVELSYATVQGYDCLVEKFRNSAIMSEYKDYRPKLWYTYDSAPDNKMVGSEAPFPSANNLSKKQRSHDNAGQLGLYAPRSGFMSRERGRRSQYDRGTPAQLQEDAYYQHMSPLNGYGAGYTYGMQPRVMGPPPNFPPMAYANGFNNGFNHVGNPYMSGNAMMANQGYGGYGQYDGVDPFGPANYTGGFANGHGNGYGNSFGTGPNTPPSRLRTQTRGRLGSRPNNVISVGGPVQSPTGGGGYGYNGWTMPKVMEDQELAAAHINAIDENGYNETAGPHYYPHY